MYFSFLPWGSGEWPQVSFPSIPREVTFCFPFNFFFSFSFFFNFFLNFFFFCTKVATGSVLGIRLALGGSPLHLLLPGFDSVSVCEKTIFSLKQ